MKDCGLGTPATRAATIETLLQAQVHRAGGQAARPHADRGSALIERLPVPSLASPELTGAWEARLARIARGQESRAAFMADIARYVRGMVTARDPQRRRAAPRPGSRDRTAAAPPTARTAPPPSASAPVARADLSALSARAS